MQKLTKEQALIISGFTGVAAIEFRYIHEDIEKRLGRPVWTHELANKNLWEEIKDKYRDDFLAMIPD